MAVLKDLNKSLSGRTVLYLTGSLTLNFLSVIAAPIFVRLMTTVEYGQAAIFFTWATILSNIVGLRIDGTVQNAKSHYGRERLAAYCASCLVLSAIALVAVLLVSAVIAAPLSSVSGLSVPYWMLAVVTGFFLTCSNVRSLYFTAMKRATGDLFISLLLAISQIALSIAFLLVLFSDGFAGRVWGYALPTIIIGICLASFFLLKGKTLFNRDYWGFCLTLCIPLIFNGIAYLLINQCGRLVINYELGAAEAGIFSFAYSCALPISVVASAFNKAWTPEYYELLDEGSTGVMHKRADGYMRNMTLIGCALMLVSPEVLVLLGTAEYYSGTYMLPMIVLAYYFQYLYTWPVNCKFYYRKTKSIAISTAIAAVANILLCFLFVRMFGAIGAAGASLAAFALLFLLHHVTAKKELSAYDFSLAWMLKGTAFVVAALTITYLLMDWQVARWAMALVVCVPFLWHLKTKRTLF